MMAEVFCGVAASPGYALGPAFHYVPYEPSVSPSIIENRQSQENIGYYSAAREAAREELETLRRQVREFTLPITGTCGFDQAQVTAGGLRTGEFDPRTMESRLVPGFYACGEVLDIDGDCGGFNLQWAWASGRLAGRLLHV